MSWQTGFKTIEVPRYSSIDDGVEVDQQLLVYKFHVAVLFQEQHLPQISDRGPRPTCSERALRKSLYVDIYGIVRSRADVNAAQSTKWRSKKKGQ